MESLISSAKALADALDNLDGAEHPWSKTIRRFLNKSGGTQSELVSKFKTMIDHEDGLLDSVDNELIQICYSTDNREHEHRRVQMCIEIITAKTTFVKNILAIA